MKRPSASTVKAVGVTGGMVAAALSTGWVGVALLIIAIIAPIIAICWILADAHRPQRLALLLTTWRHSTTTPTRRSTTTKPRRAINESPAAG